MLKAIYLNIHYSFFDELQACWLFIISLIANELLLCYPIIKLDFLHNIVFVCLAYCIGMYSSILTVTRARM